MHGGMHGAVDRDTGAIEEPGWAALGFPQSVEADTERTWAALEAR